MSRKKRRKIFQSKPETKIICFIQILTSRVLQHCMMHCYCQDERWLEKSIREIKLVLIVMWWPWFAERQLCHLSLMQRWIQVSLAQLVWAVNSVICKCCCKHPAIYCIKREWECPCGQAAAAGRVWVVVNLPCHCPAAAPPSPSPPKVPCSFPVAPFNSL